MMVGAKVCDLLWFVCGLYVGILTPSIVPLPKINNPKLVSDFRPISLLPLPGKIIEKLLHSQHLIT